jgi:hypothetical protein
VFGFIPESVFTFIPESCSESSRNAVQLHPGIAFTLPRNPQYIDPETATGLKTRTATDLPGGRL